jgi:hypothetical protein
MVSFSQSSDIPRSNDGGGGKPRSSSQPPLPSSTVSGNNNNNSSLNDHPIIQHQAYADEYSKENWSILDLGGMLLTSPS